MTLIIDIPDEQNPPATNILADSIAPLFSISDEQKNAWWLWLDFIAEIQAKLMIVNEATAEEGFAFRCAENFKALRQTLGILASHGVNPQQLQDIKNELQNLQNELQEGRDKLQHTQNELQEVRNETQQTQYEPQNT